MATRTPAQRSIFDGPYVHPMEMSDTDYRRWLQSIRRGIGGYQIASLMGLDGAGTPREVFDRMLDLAPRTEMTAMMHRGRLLEDDAVELLVHTYGLTAEPGDFIKDRENKFFVGQVDGYVTEGSFMPKSWGKGLIEGKVPDSYWMPRIREEGVNEAWLYQANWYMGITGCTWTLFAVLDYDNWTLLGGKTKPVIYRFDADLYAEMKARAEQFLEDHIYTRTPPPPELLADDPPYQLPVLGQEEVVLTEPAHLAALERLFHARRDKKLAAEQEKRARAEVERIMVEVDADCVTTGDGRKVTWRSHDRRSFNQDAAIAELRRRGLDPDDFYESVEVRPFRASGD